MSPSPEVLCATHWMVVYAYLYGKQYRGNSIEATRRAPRVESSSGGSSSATRYCHVRDDRAVV
jgi:hypothetical protein